MSLITDHAQALDKAAKLEIPGTAFVTCPATNYRHVRVARCPGCPNFRGFVDTIPQASQPVDFVSRYRVFCGQPITRSLVHVEID